MNTFTFSDAELEVLRQAVENYNDFVNDTTFDGIESVNMFPRSAIAVTPSEMSALREELNQAITKHCHVNSLMTKLGLSINEQGYSV